MEREQREQRGRRAARGLVCALLMLTSGALAARQAPHPTGKVPITTPSDEARELYLRARDLAEKLRVTDAHRVYEQAVAKDPSFALAYVGLANTAGTTKEFIDATNRAASVDANLSEGERLIVNGLDAGLKGDPARVLASYRSLVRLFPEDERAHMLLGVAHFGRQEYEDAISEFGKAIAINAAFSSPYNQLGYAYRFIGKYDEAEKAFKKYIELIPGDPNPYDSYAELLMKTGRFDESIASYEKALAIDGHFLNSFVGIGNDYLFMDKPEQARAAFGRMAAAARTTGERRQAHFWMAASYVHEGATDNALAELKKEYALADAEHDAASMSGDLTVMGDVLREAGRYDEALAKYADAVSVIDGSQVPAEVKEATHRNHLFEQARVAAVRGDVATAKAREAAYAAQVLPRRAPFELRQQHEIAGLIALAEKRPSAAAEEFSRANQLDPRILYMTAVALRQAGDASRASAAALKAASFNSLNFNFAYVRAKARQSVGSSDAGYSSRSVGIGSTGVARYAGMVLASMPMAVRSSATAAYADASVPVNPEDRRAEDAAQRYRSGRRRETMSSAPSNEIIRPDGDCT
jgi:tetratricopeptide (TPR) repeat protein